MPSPNSISRRPFALLSSALLLIGLLGSLGCAESEEQHERPGDLILITIDTLRADHLGAYGYERPTSPNIDRWFADGLRVERAYSTESSTSPSVVSFLSGLLPQEHGVRLFFQLIPEDVMLLPDLLPESYQSAGVVSNMVLTDEAMGFAARFDHFDDFVDQRESERPVFERQAAATTDAAIRWLEEDRDSSRPSFLWVHYIDPHGPYKPPADAPAHFEHEGRVELQPKRMPGYALLEGVDDALTYIDRYDAEIAYVDREVNRLLNALDAQLDLDRSLLMLTSDHGESLMDHERWFTHGYQVYEEMIHVPLLIRAPGVEAASLSGLSSGIDVAVTMLAFAGRPAPAGSRGVDLLAPDPLPADRRVFAEASRTPKQWRAALQSSQKLMVQLRGEQRLVLEQRSYDLATDPGETRPAPWDSDSELSDHLMELLTIDPDPSGIPNEYRAGLRLEAPKVSPSATEKQLEGLRALGYAE